MGYKEMTQATETQYDDYTKSIMLKPSETKTATKKAKPKVWIMLIVAITYSLAIWHWWDDIGMLRLISIWLLIAYITALLFVELFRIHAHKCLELAREKIETGEKHGPKKQQRKEESKE